MTKWYVGVSLTDTDGSVPLVAEFTVAEVAADCVDADCICVAVAIDSSAFVDV